MKSSFVGVLLALGVGCSNPFTEKRPTPLPAGVEPFDVRNLHPESPPPLTPEARDYLSRFPAEEEKVPVIVMEDNSATVTKLLPAKADVPAIETKRVIANMSKVQDSRKAVQGAESAAKTLSKVLPNQKDVPVLGQFIPDQLLNSLADGLNMSAKKQVKQLEREAIDNVVLPGSRYNTLVLSGGTAHGAYQAGVLNAWKDRGDLPTFDVVTGVSTGALISALVFPGTQHYDDLKTFYTTTTRKDVYRFKKLPPMGLGTESVASNEPLRGLLKKVLCKPGYFEEVAAEHAKGRRFYVGTTNIDTMRFTTWDMGAIASQGTPESRQLYEDILLGASALPVLFPPSKITINIDGQSFTEFHSDGGTTRNLFIYPPSDWPGSKHDPFGRLLAGAKVFVVFGGKVYGDPAGTDPKLLPLAIRSLNTLVSSCQRAEMFRIYTQCRTRDIEFKLAAIPEALRPLFPSSEFDPEKMTQLYCLAYTRMMNNEAWNEDELLDGITEVIPRRSSCLTTQETGVAERGGFSLPPARGLRPPARTPVPITTTTNPRR